MKKLFCLLMMAALAVSATESSTASTTALSVRLPDEGYEYGYPVGERYAASNPTPKQLCTEWHRAVDNVDFYYSINEAGRAEWWQGYADGLHYYDNNSSCPLPQGPCDCYNW